MDILQNTLKIMKQKLNLISLLLSFSGLYTFEVYFLYTEQWYANSKVHFNWLMLSDRFRQFDLTLLRSGSEY